MAQINSNSCEPFRTLLIEDNNGDALQIEYLLTDAIPNVELMRASRLSQGLRELSEHSFDVILLDLTLPDCQGIKTFFQVYAQAPQIPIIIFSGFYPERYAPEALRRGAKDYLIKGQITSKELLHSIAKVTFRDRSSQLKAA